MLVAVHPKLLERQLHIHVQQIITHPLVGPPLQHNVVRQGAHLHGLASIHVQVRAMTYQSLKKLIF